MRNIHKKSCSYSSSSSLAKRNNCSIKFCRQGVIKCSGLGYSHTPNQFSTCYPSNGGIYWIIIYACATWLTLCVMYYTYTCITHYIQLHTPFFSLFSLPAMDEELARRTMDQLSSWSLWKWSQAPQSTAPSLLWRQRYTSTIHTMQKWSYLTYSPSPLRHWWKSAETTTSVMLWVHSSLCTRTLLCSTPWSQGGWRSL